MSATETGAEFRSSPPTTAKKLGDGEISGWTSPPEVDAVSWLRAARAVFAKELRVEWRTKYSAGIVLLFGFSTLVAISAALGPVPVRSEVKAALLWIVLLFAALSGLSRVFVREEEAGTAAALRLYAPPTAVYAGKWLLNLSLTALIEAIVAPLFLLVLPPAALHTGLFAAVLGLGGFGLAGASTFVAAVIAPASSGRSALFFVVAFPVLLPLLLTCVQATVGAFSEVGPYIARAEADLTVLAGYAVVMTTASVLLFRQVWHD